METTTIWTDEENLRKAYSTSGHNIAKEFSSNEEGVYYFELMEALVGEGWA